MTVAYACDCMCCVWEFHDEIILKGGGGGGGGNVKLEKNRIFLKNGKIVICFYSTDRKPGNFLDFR